MDGGRHADRTEPINSRLIFVTGASRSGTTLTAQLLGRHSEIAKLKEMQFFGEFWDPRLPGGRQTGEGRLRAIHTLFDRQEHGVVRGRADEHNAEAKQFAGSLPVDIRPAELFAATVMHFAAREGKSIACDQTPRNIFYAAALLDYYPNARIVHLVRDPRGVMASQKYRWRLRSLSRHKAHTSLIQPLRTWVNYHPYTVAQLWNKATRLALNLVDHPRFKLIRFEDLIERPESTLRDVAAFLEVPFESTMLDVAQVNSSHDRGNETSGGFNRSTLERWRATLTRDELAVVDARCGRLMKQVGYDAEAPKEPSLVGRLTYPPRYLLHLTGAAAVNPRRLAIQARALLFAQKRHIPTHHDRPGPDVPDSHEDAAEGPFKTVFGLRFHDAPLAVAARQLVDHAARGDRLKVMFVNANSINQCVRNEQLKSALFRADRVYADGVGMALAARTQRCRLEHNVNGTDLFPHLCRLAAKRGMPIGMFGAAPGIVDRCVERLRRQYPDLKIVWHYHGYPSRQAMPSIIEEINASGAGMLFVAQGTPRQEMWIHENRAALTVPVVFGVGGLFDFVSGRIPRAPRTLRRLRLEWVFRLAKEPRRMFGRYVIGVPVFISRTIWFATFGKLWHETADHRPTI